MCVAVINSPNNGHAVPPPLPSVCDFVSGGRESDLISINCVALRVCRGPIWFLGTVSQRANTRETARCTHSL